MLEWQYLKTAQLHRFINCAQISSEIWKRNGLHEPYVMLYSCTLFISNLELASRKCSLCYLFELLHNRTIL